MIEIIPLKDASQIVTFMNIEDNIEDIIDGTKLEWIQYLCKVVKSEKYLIAAVLVDKILKGYFVCFDDVDPPLSSSITLFYISELRDIVDSEGKEVSKKIIIFLKKWAKIRGAKRIEGLTRYPLLAKEFGFKVRKNIKAITMEI